MKNYKIKFKTGAVIKLQADHIKTTDSHYIFYNEKGEEISLAWKWNSEVVEEQHNEFIKLTPLNFEKAGTRVSYPNEEKPRSA